MSNIKNVAMITVCGRPNVGKSSLTNALVGEKVAIVSNKAQTTRNRIYGVVNREDTQYILLDTPGLHKPKSALGDYMVKVVTSSLSDVDCALLLCLDKEIPHGTAVEITKFSERDSGVIDVDATIYCEKASHKGIIIGKQGAMLKKISSLARQDMEKFMGTKVYLETWVKVKENWRDNVNYVRSFGYRDE